MLRPLVLALLLVMAQPMVLTAQVAAVDTSSAAPAEDSASQLRTVADAYSLLMDRYVHPLDSAALVAAGWDQLTQEAAARKGPAPGPAPTLVGDRATDLD